ncbi:hypothetical protein EKK58_04010 [Candidatus Dependentiae bacterium]|nr:MAG: hypothetical protein EKK58_04010 [Candidatus Dependentiae bacterium]
MSKTLFVLCALSNLLLPGYIMGWATPEQNVNNNAKSKVNFGGSIKVHQGNKWDNIENITVDGKSSQIQMRVLPESLPPITLNQQTGKNEVILKDDPNGRAGYTILKIDLTEIKSLASVPNLTYIYKAQSGNVTHTVTYVELIITPKDSGLKSYHCLALDTVKVKWDEKSSAGPVNMETPIGAIALLEINTMQIPELPSSIKNIQ